MKRKLTSIARVVLLAGLSFTAVSSAAIADIASAAVKAEPAAESATPAGKEPVAQADTVNINSATTEELQSVLKGIGRTKAQAIVDYRTENGPFTSVDQLLEVKGIGKGTLDKNRDRISL